jgi:hypothetical protein
VVLATEAAPTRTIYNVVDDASVCARDLYRFHRRTGGHPEPQPGGKAVLPSLGCSNARLKASLNWTPAYPTYRSGLA